MRASPLKFFFLRLDSNPSTDDRMAPKNKSSKKSRKPPTSNFTLTGPRMEMLEDEPASPGTSESTPFAVKAKAILLTYNQLPDGLTIEQLTLAFSSATFLKSVRYWSVCLEQGSRVHAHAYLEANKQFDSAVSYFDLAIAHQDSVFMSKPSHCVSNMKKGSSYRGGANCGHFYVQCKYKNTHIAQFNNYEACSDFTVKTIWVQELWQKGKINDNKVLPCAGFYRCCTPALEGLVRHSVGKLRVEVKAESRATRMRMLEELKAPHKQYAEINEWKKQYTQVAFRYKFLIISGPTRTGKTQLARSLFSCPFEHNDAVCWINYDDEKHDAVIFDDVKFIYKYISDNRALFQAGGLATVQTSATNMYSMQIDMTQKPIIVTCNDEPRGDWILGNSIRLYIEEPTWECDDTTQIAVAVPVADNDVGKYLGASLASSLSEPQRLEIEGAVHWTRENKKLCGCICGGWVTCAKCDVD